VRAAAKNDGCPGKRGAFSQKASLFEAEVSWPAVEGSADNQMINHVYCKIRAPSPSLRVSRNIAFARGRVARGMIVHKDECVGRI
jgi:hypothetical protein